LDPFLDLQTTARPDNSKKYKTKSKVKKDGKKEGGPMLYLYHPPTGVQTTQNSTPDKELVLTKKLVFAPALTPSSSSRSPSSSSRSSTENSHGSKIVQSNCTSAKEHLSAEGNP
jgi:hypothetical protein